MRVIGWGGDAFTYSVLERVEWIGRLVRYIISINSGMQDV